MTNDRPENNPTPASDSQLQGDADGEQRDANVVTLGLVPSPEHCERMAAGIADDLPELLASQVDDRVTWKVSIVPDPLSGSNVETPELLTEVEQQLTARGWDYAIGLTDLPVRRNECGIVADVSIRRNIAWISVPALGVVRPRDRVRAAVLQLTSEMRWGTTLDANKRQEDQREPDAGTGDQRDHSPDQLIGPSIARRVIPADSGMDIDVRYVAPPVIGHARLLTGMVYANRPWTLFPSFKTTVATAFATGAYGLIFTNLWKLGNTYETWRLAMLTVTSMAILIGWIIISHRLWEPYREGSSRYLTVLYNTATLLTISEAVIFTYIMVFILLLLSATAFIPASMLGSTIGRPTSPVNYVNVAWVTASVAMIAGAVGAGLEDTEAVRNATFGWRQQRRFEEHQQENEDE